MNKWDACRQHAATNDATDGALNVNGQDVGLARQKMVQGKAGHKETVLWFREGWAQGGERHAGAGRQGGGASRSTVEKLMLQVQDGGSKRFGCGIKAPGRPPITFGPPAGWGSRSVHCA